MCKPISRCVNAHRGYLSESSVCITQNSFMKNKFWAQRHNISSSSSSFFLAPPPSLSVHTAIFAVSKLCFCVIHKVSHLPPTTTTSHPPHPPLPPSPPLSSSPCFVYSLEGSISLSHGCVMARCCSCCPGSSACLNWHGKGSWRAYSQNCEVLWR